VLLLISKSQTCNKDLKNPPIRTFVIPSNQEAPYTDQWRGSKQPHQHHKTKSSKRHSASVCHRVHITLPSAATFCRQKYAIKIPTSSEAQRHKLLKFQNFKIFFGPPFLGIILGLRGSCLPLRNPLVARDLTTTDVSTTFPASFFTVMPKGLTTGPKSMSD